MEITAEHYRMAKVAYDGFCKQTNWKISGAPMPQFDELQGYIKDSWASAYIAISNELYRQGNRPPNPEA